MVIATRENEQDNPLYQQFVQIFQSAAVSDFLAETFNGTIEPAY